jgi:hypothetical protein
MTIRITREQYARDLSKITKPDPLEIDPIEYGGYKNLMKQRFMVYVPEEYKRLRYENTLDKIFNQMVGMTTTFTRADVSEAVKRLITL